MPETTPDALPYPEDGDTPDVPRDLQALADAVQAALDAKTAEIDATILYGPVADLPATLLPGQLYAGW